jgi:delta-aminolevulinic acid dehydratase/porphobilinogen synthase
LPCEYTSHGHCGIIVDDEIANDVTVEQLARAACRTPSQAPMSSRRPT